MRKIVRRYAVAIVSDRQSHPAHGPIPGRPPGPLAGSNHGVELQKHPPPLGHRVPRVQHQIHHDLLDHPWIDTHRRDLGGGLDFEHRVFAQEAVEEPVHAGNNVGEVGRFDRDDLPPAEGQQLSGQAGGAAGRALDLKDTAPRLSAQVRIRGEERGIPQDGRQQIIEVMSNASRQLTHGLHFLRLAQPFLERVAGR